MTPDPVDPLLAKLADTRRQILERMSDDYRAGWAAGYREGYEDARTGGTTGAYVTPDDVKADPFIAWPSPERIDELRGEIEAADGLWDYVPGPVRMTAMTVPDGTVLTDGTIKGQRPTLRERLGWRSRQPTEKE